MCAWTRVALIDECHITATPYFDKHATTESEAAPADNGKDADQQETKPKSRVAAEILANGYVLQDQIVAKGLEYDNKYGLSSRLQGYLGFLQSNGKYTNGLEDKDESLTLYFL